MDPHGLTVMLDLPGDDDSGIGAAAWIIDRFTLGEPLGAGGMGLVVEAVDREVDRVVAVKRASREATEREARLLVHEARIQGRLDHPSIPPVFELGRDPEGRPAFAMRRVSGVTLASLLDARRSRRQQRPLAVSSPTRMLRVFLDVCRAVEHAHARGVVHCDLKPSNIMIDADGRVQVIDWGVATVIGDGLAVPRRAGGTFGYMAPEQEAGLPLDGRADIFALGAILFEMLADEPMAVPAAVGSSSTLRIDARPSRRVLGGAIPAVLDEVCVRATHERPADRFATVAELAAAVIDWLDGARDQALRIELAGEAMAEARAALDQPLATDPARALRAAGRAFALTPEAAGPASLVRRLVERDDVADDAVLDLAVLGRDNDRRIARVAVWAYLGLLMMPLQLLIQGGADLGFLALTVVTWFSLEALALPVAMGRGTITGRWWWWSVGLLAFECVLCARYLGPFMLPPSMAALTVAGAMLHPRVHRRGAIVLVMCCATLAPFALEQLGVLSSTIAVVDGRLRLSSAVSELQPVVTLVGLALYTMSLLAVAVAIGKLMATSHDVRRALAAQTWHLEQLVLAADDVEGRR